MLKIIPKNEIPSKYGGTCQRPILLGLDSEDGAEDKEKDKDKEKEREKGEKKATINNTFSHFVIQKYIFFALKVNQIVITHGGQHGFEINSLFTCKTVIITDALIVLSFFFGVHGFYLPFTSFIFYTQFKKNYQHYSISFFGNRVELKSGDTYNGHLVNSDSWMNLYLKDVICTSRDGDKFWRINECYIRGNTVKYLSIASDVMDSVKEEDSEIKAAKMKGNIKKKKKLKKIVFNSKRGGRGRGGESAVSK
ncbi:hypothetical protein RFI_16343 [Reticulomyxa filosa]|uniref:U6 snRNA-associated Sm-like protein LSm4 n=1 Tax=Reticulomyxa filosa TaxID=46433 RepID=X6N4R0_RETFI|nr:hypothetical protein RFI_16343 [Reticulomyxa filosa]|eukprot:ETO20868.1 hypothetical protein RFI_16343 [Reticulomyxa filosa]